MKAFPTKAWATFIKTEPNEEGDEESVLNFKSSSSNVFLSSSPTTIVHDNTWMQVNQAQVNLIRETSNQPDEIAQPLSVAVAEEQKKVMQSKINRKKTKVKKEKQDEEKDASPPPPPPPIQRTKTIPPKQVMDDQLPIESLEDHNRRDNQHSLFALNAERTTRSTQDYVVKEPPISSSSVLAYCAKYKNTDVFPWFSTMQNFVASDERYTYPDVPSMARVRLRQYMREPDPNKPWERPCINLDRDPTEHGMQARCVAHIMSDKATNGKGFRLRELHVDETETLIQVQLDNKKDPMQCLQKIPEMCVLCHLWFGLRDAIAQRDHIENTGDTNVVIINRFMVHVDVIGEYDRNKMLTGDSASIGIWGPFPLFNMDNYIYNPRMTDSGLRGFDESDNLLFRLTRVSSLLTASSEKTTSNPSNPTRGESRLTISSSQ